MTKDELAGVSSFTSILEENLCADLNRMIKGELLIRFSDSKTARAIDVALLPDNVKIPRGMKITQTRRGKALKIEVTIKEERSLHTLISTLDEFLSHIQSAVQILEKID